MLMPSAIDAASDYEELHIKQQDGTKKRVRIRGETLLQVLLAEGDCIDIDMIELGAGSTCTQYAAQNACQNTLHGHRMAEMTIADFCPGSCGKCGKDGNQIRKFGSAPKNTEEVAIPPPPAPAKHVAAPPVELSKDRPASGYYGVEEDNRRGRIRYKVYLIVDGEKERVKTWFHTKGGAAAAFDLEAHRKGLLCGRSCNFKTVEEAEAASAAEAEFVTAAHEAQMQLSRMTQHLG
jgi:hypothetical protein